MQKEITLGDFLKILVLTMQEKNIPMPISDGETLMLKPWHAILYRLKTSQNLNPKPEFLERLIFDWDAGWPNCQEAINFILNLHAHTKSDWTNPYASQTVQISRELINLWKEKYKKEIAQLKPVLEEAVKIAQEEFIA